MSGPTTLLGDIGATDLAADRRQDVGVGEIDLRGLQARFVLHDCTRGLLVRGARLVAGDDRAGLSIQQFLRPLQLELAEDFCRLAALQRSLSLAHRSLELVLLDAVQGSAFLDQVALLEQHLLQEAGHPRPDLDAIDRLDAPDEVQRIDNRLAFGADGAHGNGGWLPLLPRRRTGDSGNEDQGTDCAAHIASLAH